MFDNLFKENKGNDNSYKKEYNSNKFNKGNREKKINLFKETPEKMELPKDIVVSNDIAIVLYDNKELPGEIKEKFKELFSKMKDNNVNARIMCINSNELLPLIKESYDDKKVNLVKPWAKFCSVEGYRTWLPSNTDIKLAANYVNKFDNLPAGLKYIKSGYITLLTSYTGKNMAKFVVVYDPFNNGKDKIDYTKSKDTFDLYRIVNNLGGMAIYNVANENEFKTLMDLL